MKIHEIIEARSNPHLNPRGLHGKTEAVNFLKSIPEDQLKYYGVRMTETPKFGLNTLYDHHNPIGIYFYPATYFISVDELPYFGDLPYIQILKINSNRILDSDTYTEESFLSDMSKLKSVVTKLAEQYKVRIKNSDVNRTVDEIVQDLENEYFETDMGKMWYVLKRSAEFLSTDTPETRKAVTPRTIVLWNKLFRSLGYDVVIDSGSGVMDDDAPTQGVVLNTATVSLVKRFTNEKSSQPDLIPDPSWIRYYINYQGTLEGFLKELKKTNAEIVGKNLQSGDISFTDYRNFFKRVANVIITHPNVELSLFSRVVDVLKFVKKYPIDSNIEIILLHYVKGFLPQVQEVANNYINNVSTAKTYDDWLKIQQDPFSSSGKDAISKLKEVLAVINTPSLSSKKDLIVKNLDKILNDLKNTATKFTAI